MTDVQRQQARERNLVDLVDTNGSSIGETTVEEAHTRPGRLHRAFSAFLINSAGDILLQRRAHTKIRYPGIWGPSCCGHAVPGEDLLVTARRRIHEELGVHPEALRQAGPCTYWIPDPASGQVDTEYNHVLVGCIDADPVPDPSEIGELRWITAGDLDHLTAAPGETDGAWIGSTWAVARTHPRIKEWM
ncbi:isopentenyl-diphosphate Delta-isomerase [Streptomyces sp. IMTB 2501]|uniref:isopentenyl-diphosphate Delta-isomerase n=1 Tax=Streptomyces sp. IMTB 2501 TaxID=1776340 RepID=UPI0015B93D18|nr:isopentenyl-diphosphate Delta-isomerase [Streptomyces sp. IMTB 2501]